MIQFILLTLISYISIDFAVYWLGEKKNLMFSEIIHHHLKLLPVYLFANVLITLGFNAASSKGYNPILIFGISVGLWIISLLVVGMILYRSFPSWLSFVGFMLILFGVVIIQFSVK